MDQTRFTLIGLVGLLLLAAVGGVVLQLWQSDSTIDAVSAESTRTVISQTLVAVTSSAEIIPTVAPTEAVIEPTRQSNESLLLDLAQDWHLVTWETWDDDRRGWSASGSGDNVLGERFVENSQFIWEMSATDDFTWSYAPLGAPFTNFYAEVSVEKRDPAVGATGIVFRYQDRDNYFDFGICPDNRSYQVWRQIEDDWKELVACVSAESINPAGTNRIAIVAQRDRYLLFINDQFLQTIEDDTFTGGRVGVAVDLDLGETNRIAFDNFLIRSPLDR